MLDPRSYPLLNDSGIPNFTNRILIGTATTGLVRVEWVSSRYGQIIPCNWSHAEIKEFMSGYYPLRYQVADAQNLIVRYAVEQDYEWLFLLEHDVILPADGFIRLNEYMRSNTIPVVSGLYYTRSRPSEPLVYRGRGNSYYGDWKMGDLVWADGVPTGALLIHMSILKEMWKDSPEYFVNRAGGKIVTRRVFETPRSLWVDPETGLNQAAQGTSDLEWCTRVIREKFFERAGWPEIQAQEFPFLVDTNISCQHIGMDGQIFP